MSYDYICLSLSLCELHLQLGYNDHNIIIKNHALPLIIIDINDYRQGSQGKSPHSSTEARNKTSALAEGRRHPLMIFLSAET